MRYSSSLSFLCFMLVFMLGMGSVAHASALDTTTGSFVSTGNNDQTQSTGNTTSGNQTLINPLQGGSSLESFLTNILTFIISIGAIIVVLMLVYVGFKFVAARGEPGELSKARQMLLWTIIGALILLGAQAIAIGIKETVQALSTGS